MLTLLKLLRSLIKTLHSDGSPGQIAAGVALGAALGLTPIMNAHNLIVFMLLTVLNVSFAAGMFAWAVFVPVGFLLDPVFDRVGHALLVATPALRPLWTTWDNVPGLALTNFNNTVVLGSVVVWLLLFVPLYVATAYGVVRYRATLGERVRQSRFYKALHASQLYNVYAWFRP
ncbi:MAG TPA: TIGR03546 family protein [Gemmatimonadaceae bacterium]|nr:TIGR03546 family protein [Gemmatimonadaceae bacterium]